MHRFPMYLEGTKKAPEEPGEMPSPSGAFCHCDDSQTIIGKRVPFGIGMKMMLGE